MRVHIFAAIKEDNNCLKLIEPIRKEGKAHLLCMMNVIFAADVNRVW